MLNNLKIPEISKQIKTDEVFEALNNNYQSIAPIWSSHQSEWLNSIYSSFKDHDKFLILIYLTNKTLNFYSKNLVKLNYDQFYSKESIEIEDFNITEVSKNLHIPKESARRKILELENSLVIKRGKRKIILDRSAFPFIKPINSVKRISRFLSFFSNIIYEEKIFYKRLSTLDFQDVILNNFSYIWNKYYEIQIPMLLSYKQLFGDLETFHIWGTCINNSFHRSSKVTLKKGKLEFINTLFDEKAQGINAMSVSDITGIPRATVVRKLKKLIKLKCLYIDEKKHYKMYSNFTKKLIPTQNNVLRHLAVFSAIIYNLTL